MDTEALSLEHQKRRIQFTNKFRNVPHLSNVVKTCFIQADISSNRNLPSGSRTETRIYIVQWLDLKFRPQFVANTKLHI